MLSQKLGGRYQIISHLGGGGFGQTYLAEDWHLPGQPRCVVKQLKPRVTDSLSFEAAQRLFDTEASALYQLGCHNQIPRLLAHFEENKQFYLVQEYIEGVLLSDELTPDNLLSESQVIELLQDILKTLAYVHENQVIHRDIKPSNLIRRHSDQKIILIDFGSVKQVSNQPIEEDGQLSITIAIGSMGYMPNEQLAGQPCLSSDIYAVGMLAIQALTGIEPKRLRKDPKNSEVLWREQVAISPEMAEVLDKMVRYDYRQRYPTAIEALTALSELTNETLALEPVATLPALGENIAWLERGDELFSQNRYHEALACYEKVLQSESKNYEVWFKQGLALENLQHFEEAIVAYDRVLQLRPDDYLAWLKRGKALEALERYEGALAAYEEVARIQPENYWVWHDRGQILEKLQDLEEAIQAYNRAIQLKPDFQSAKERRKAILLQLKRVDHLYQLQHYEEAIAACERAIQENPEDALAWLMQGMALENLGQDWEAALSYSRVVKLQPEDHVAWFKLAHVLEKVGKYQKAALAYGRVVKLQPHNYWAWHQQGKVLEQLKDSQRAIAAYNRAIQIKPDLQATLQARQRLLKKMANGDDTHSPKLRARKAIAASDVAPQSA
ncbi:tetratricopeptide repeat protein [Almyronema epifaneia]|uniref:Tetratricopeptide repeat protein n=1 Tax=Almyronema epifaneia S1 TaxID=2991925 RepID=A0ABW6I9W3_9CYAN